MDWTSVFGLVVLTWRCVMAGRMEALIYEEFDSCDKLERTVHLINPRIVTLAPGVTVGRADAVISKDSEVKLAHVDTYVCDLNKQNCIRFLNWKRDGDLCALALMKNMIWTPLWNLQPPLHCPVLKKGPYHLENGTLDTAKLNAFGFPMNRFVRIKVDLYEEKNKPFFCFIIGASRKFIKT